MCDCFRLAYLADFLEAANLATSTADREVASTLEAARVYTTETSQVNDLPAFQVISAKPSRRFL